ncbi:MAG TPA: hypothetical protein VFE90_14215 [Myxococcales bacterium]|jgi:hypothetical protein|nr:hypothetical protein [Myxococcales bacterium]
MGVQSLLRSIAGAALLSAACGSGDPQATKCTQLLLQYAKALPVAAACDPAVTGSCSTSRATASLDPAGAPFLCTNCETNVNPANVAPLDALFSQYQAAGCHVSEETCPCTEFSGKPGVCAGNGVCN